MSGDTAARANELVDEWTALLRRAREAISRESYVEAEGWVKRVVESIEEHDVFSALAAEEIIAVEDDARKTPS